MRFQVQPQYKNAAVWEKLAEEEKVSFEIIELSIPQIRQNEVGEEGEKWYRGLPNITSIHGHFMDINPGSSDPDMAALSLKKMEKSCELAKELQVSQVVFHSGIFPYLKGKYLEGWAANAAKVYDSLAAKYDLQIFIENSQDLDSQPLAEMMKQVTDDRVGICLDIGHTNYARESMKSWFKNLGEYVRYIHLSDNTGLYDDHYVLGTGSVDWNMADRLVMELNRDMPITLETGNPAKTAASLKFLKKHGYFGL